LHNGWRGLADVQLRRALATQPDQHSGRIHPIKRPDSAGYPDCFITLQTLQGLNEKHSVVNFAINANGPMDAFALNKKLLFHGDRPFPRAAPRELRVENL
jgi:hypothetical protein